MKYISFLLLSIACAIFLSDLYNVMYLKDLFPFIKNEWKSPVAAFILFLSIALYSMGKEKHKQA